MPDQPTRRRRRRRRRKNPAKGSAQSVELSAADSPAEKTDPEQLSKKNNKKDQSKARPKTILGMPRTVAIVGFSVLVIVLVAQIISAIVNPAETDPFEGSALSFPDQGRRHLESNETFDSYNSFPPTSGPQMQYGAEPGIYGEGKPPPFGDSPSFSSLLPILERGGIVIYYDDKLLGLDEIKSLEVLAEGTRSTGSRHNIVVTPLQQENRGSGAIYATAWTHVLTLTSLTEESRTVLLQFLAPNPEGFYGRFLLESQPNLDALDVTEK